MIAPARSLRRRVVRQHGRQFGAVGINRGGAGLSHATASACLPVGDRVKASRGRSPSGQHCRNSDKAQHMDPNKPLVPGMPIRHSNYMSDNCSDSHNPDSNSNKGSSENQFDIPDNSLETTNSCWVN